MNQGLLTNTVSEKLVHQAFAYARRYRYAVLGVLVCGLLAYTYLFTNKLVNLDELYYLFGKGATLESGRWGLVLLSWIFPDYSMPWVYGILSFFLYGVGICLCIHMFSIQNKLLQFLVAGAMITFPALSATFTYTFTISSYGVSFLLAVISVYLLSRGGVKAILAALVCGVVSVSIYQAYIAITASLLILILIQRTLQGEQSEKKLFLSGLGFVLFLAGTLGIYWLSAKLAWGLSGTSVGSYAGSALSLDRFAILRNVKNAYASTFRILWSGYYGLIATPVSRGAHLLCGAILVVEALIWMKRNGKPLRILLLVFLAALLPLSMNCMFLFVNDIMIHSLVMYAFVALYLLTAILLEHNQCLMLNKALWNRVRKWGYELVLLGLALVIAGNVYFANKGYLNLHLQYESTHAFATSVLSTLQNTPGFTADSKVAIVGEYQRPQSMEERFSYLTGIYGLEGISPDTYSIGSLFEYYCGVALNLASEEEVQAITETESFSQMPVYPGYGSVREIQGVYVIRLS